MALSKSIRVEEDRPQGLQEFAARSIARAIMLGELAPGDRLSPAKLAEGLKISHIPVREALAALEATGHVVRRPGVGVFVAELSVEYIEDVYLWRRVLEDEAHRLAVPKLVDSDIVRMRKLCDAVGDVPLCSRRYVELNRQLHFVAFERAGSDTLLRFLNQLWDTSSRHQAATSTAPIGRSMLKEQHDSIVDAFEARDVERVNALMAEHRDLTLRAIREIVEARQDPTVGDHPGGQEILDPGVIDPERLA